MDKLTTRETLIRNAARLEKEMYELRPLLKKYSNSDVVASFDSYMENNEFPLALLRICSVLSCIPLRDRPSNMLDKLTELHVAVCGYDIIEDVKDAVSQSIIELIAEAKNITSADG